MPRPGHLGSLLTRTSNAWSGLPALTGRWTPLHGDDEVKGCGARSDGCRHPLAQDAEEPDEGETQQGYKASSRCRVLPLGHYSLESTSWGG